MAHQFDQKGFTLLLRSFSNLEGHVYTMLCFHRYLYQLIYLGLSPTLLDSPTILLLQIHVSDLKFPVMSE